MSLQQTDEKAVLSLMWPWSRCIQITTWQWRHNWALTPLQYDPRYEKTVFFCICENKDADQLRGNREADQRLCFRFISSAIPLLPKSEISSL